MPKGTLKCHHHLRQLKSEIWFLIIRHNSTAIYDLSGSAPVYTSGDWRSHTEVPKASSLIIRQRSTARWLISKLANFGQKPWPPIHDWSKFWSWLSHGKSGILKKCPKSEISLHIDYCPGSRALICIIWTQKRNLLGRPPKIISMVICSEHRSKILSELRWSWHFRHFSVTLSVAFGHAVSHDVMSKWHQSSIMR